MALYHGKKGRVMMSTTGSGAATTMIKMTSWSLNMATDRVEVTSFGDTNKVYVQGLRDITGDLSGYFDDTSDQLYDASASADGVKLYLYPSEDVLTKYFYGPAWVDFNITTGVSEAVAISGSIAANGSWGQI